MEGHADPGGELGRYGDDFRIICILDEEESTHQRKGYAVHYHLVCTIPALLGPDSRADLVDWAARFSAYVNTATEGEMEFENLILG